MQTYESPKVTFQQVTLFEKIATTCWSANSVYYDMYLPYGKATQNELLTLSQSECGKNNDSIRSQMCSKLGWGYQVWLQLTHANNNTILSSSCIWGFKCDFKSGNTFPTTTPTRCPTPTPRGGKGWPGHPGRP